MPALQWSLVLQGELHCAAVMPGNCILQSMFSDVFTSITSKPDASHRAVSQCLNSVLRPGVSDGSDGKHCAKNAKEPVVFVNSL